jgi:hypothetical protein
MDVYESKGQKGQTQAAEAAIRYQDEVKAGKK